MGDRRTDAQRAGALLLAVASAVCLVACGGGGGTTDTTSGPGGAATASPVPGGPAPGGPTSAAAAATPGGTPAGGGAAGLPFQYASTGQGGSPSFTIPATGTYKVDWQASGVAGAPACTVSLGLSADTSSYSVVDGVQVGPGDKKSGSTSLNLAAGGYRAVEGGGCGWSVTVRAG